MRYPFIRDEVVNDSGDDAALVLPPKASLTCPDPVLVQTIDYIKTCTSDPFVLGKIAAIHAMSDIFAMNANPVSALALCVVPLADDEIVSLL
jgi:selenide, water dikinase